MVYRENGFDKFNPEEHAFVDSEKKAFVTKKAKDLFDQATEEAKLRRKEDSWTEKVFYKSETPIDVLNEDGLIENENDLNFKAEEDVDGYLELSWGSKISGEYAGKIINLEWEKGGTIGGESVSKKGGNKIMKRFIKIENLKRKIEKEDARRMWWRAFEDQHKKEKERQKQLRKKDKEIKNRLFGQSDDGLIASKNEQLSLSESGAKIEEKKGTIDSEQIEDG